MVAALELPKKVKDPTPKLSAPKVAKLEPEPVIAKEPIEEDGGEPSPPEIELEPVKKLPEIAKSETSPEPPTNNTAVSQELQKIPAPAPPVPAAPEPEPTPVKKPKLEAIIEPTPEPEPKLEPKTESKKIVAVAPPPTHKTPPPSVKNQKIIPAKKPLASPPVIALKKPVVAPPPAPTPKPKPKAPDPRQTQKHNDKGRAFEQEGLFEKKIEEDTQAIILKPELIEAYLGRAWSHLSNGNQTKDIRDYSQAIKLKPAYGDAYFGRGWAHEKSGDADQSIRDYSEAIRLGNNRGNKRGNDNFQAYFSRGILQSYRDSTGMAADDFSAVLQQGSKQLRPYALIWMYLSQARSGIDGREALRTYGATMDLTTWSGVLVSYYLGDVTSDRVLSATQSSNPKNQRENKCVAKFFLGQDRLVRGDKAGAADYFRKTIATGVTSYRQYTAAEE